MEETKFKIGDSVIIKEEVLIGLDLLEYNNEKGILIDDRLTSDNNKEYPFSVYFINHQRIAVKEEWLEKSEYFWKEQKEKTVKIGLDFNNNLEESLKENNYTQEQLTFGQKLYNFLDDISTMLESKNKKYGDSALNPKRIFSKVDSVEQLKVRIDDKLSRIANQNVEDDEDVVNDLIGYLILYKISLNDKANSN